ncbi:MAG: hypothetical protein LBL66_10715 [Clostridiales bacterium]|jgi:hypothetical protein|nr:hypothetical protein [Clostridiales bacterium]
MKNTKRIGSKLFLCGFLLTVLFLSAVMVSGVTKISSAVSIDDVAVSGDIATVSRELFGDAEIESRGYLYNLDDSPDYIYTDFGDLGYAVYARETFELLEYSLSSGLPYSSGSRKYYAGPTHYLNREGEEFVNVATGEVAAAVGTADTVAYAREMRGRFFNRERMGHEYAVGNLNYLYDEFVDNDELIVSGIDSATSLSMSKNTPSIDRNNLIPADPPGAAETAYIPNAQYFLKNPLHGSNSNAGIPDTCGAVAAQLLLSYNNYYMDRRIIDNGFLNGSNTTLAERNKNPNFCDDPMRMTPETLGSRSGATGNDSYFLNVVNSIPTSATVAQEKNGLKNLLNARNQQIPGTINFEVNSHATALGLGWWSINTADIVSEIDQGRPLIVGMNRGLGGLDHFVVGYGYQTMCSSATNNTNQFGYIVHMGWAGNHTTSNSGSNSNVWINSSWCDSYVSLQINHTHNYNNYVGGQYDEIRCGECGHRRSLSGGPRSNNLFNPSLYEQGDSVSTSGHTFAWSKSQNAAPFTTRVRYSELIPIIAGQSYTVRVPAGYEVAAAVRNIDTVSILETGWRTAEKTLVAPAGSAYISAVFRKTGDIAISVAEIQALGSYLALNRNVIHPSLYEQGDSVGAPGQTFEWSKSQNAAPFNERVRMSELISALAGETYTIDVPTCWQMAVAFRDINTVSLFDTGWRDAASTFTAPANSAYMSVVFRRAGDGAISVSDIKNLPYQLTIKKNVLAPALYEQGDSVGTPGQTFEWSKSQNAAPFNTRVRMSVLIPVIAGQSYTINVPYGYQIAFAFRDINTVSVLDSGWRTSTATLTAPANSVYASVVFRKTGDSVIIVSQIQPLSYRLGF